MMKINLSDSDDSRKKPQQEPEQEHTSDAVREETPEESAETVVIPPDEETFDDLKSEEAGVVEIETEETGTAEFEIEENADKEPGADDYAVTDVEDTDAVQDGFPADENKFTEIEDEPLLSKKMAGMEDKSSGGDNKALLLLILLLIVLIGSIGYLKKDSIMGLFQKEKPVVQEAPPAPLQPEPEPVPEPVKTEPDPTFVVLNRIGDAVPDRLWLTSAVIMYDGSYDISGIAFTHDSMNTLVGGLGSNGNVAASSIPGKSKSAETVYRFTIDGKIDDISVPDILDNIPVADLVKASAGFKDRSADFDLTFVRLPENGRTYDDEAMPFAVTGSYKGLKELIGELCPEGGDRRIYRIVIAPSRPGRSFDRVEASFSIKTVSTL